MRGDPWSILSASLVHPLYTGLRWLGDQGGIKRIDLRKNDGPNLWFSRIVLVVVLVIVIGLFARAFDYDYDDEDDDERKIAPVKRAWRLGSID